MGKNNTFTMFNRLNGFLFITAEYKHLWSINNYAMYIFFIYYFFEECLIDRSQILVTVFENGIKSESLKYSGSHYIPWKDIKEIELVKGWFQYRRCYYLWLKPHDEIKYNYKMPFRLGFGEKQQEFGFNALSLNISLGLDIDPHYFYTVCKESHKNSINEH